jgi:hypothetical protein
MKMTAHDIVSASIAQYCRAYLTDDVFASAIAHGARNPGMAVHLNKIGTRSGIPDWIVVYRRAFFCEIKTGAGVMRKAQIDTRAALVRAGSAVMVVHCLQDFIDAMTMWGIPRLKAPRRDADDQDLPI